MNYLGTAYLALGMIPFLLKVGRRTDSPCPRLVVVGSDMHYFADISLTTLSSGSILEVLNDEHVSRCVMINITTKKNSRSDQ